MIGIPFFLFGNALNAIIRADGSPQFAMRSTVLGCLMNLTKTFRLRRESFRPRASVLRAILPLKCGIIGPLYSAPIADVVSLIAAAFLVRYLRGLLRAGDPGVRPRPGEEGGGH